MFVFLRKNRNENKKEKINVPRLMKTFFLFSVPEEAPSVTPHLESSTEVQLPKY